MDAEPDNIRHDDDHGRDGRSMPHDSMVTVRLSETPILIVDTTTLHATLPHDTLEEGAPTKNDSKEQNAPHILLDESLNDRQDNNQNESPIITMMDPNGNELLSPSGSDSSDSEDSRRGSDSSETSDGPEVNWEELEKTEEQEPRDQDSDESTALLLARLEQENNLIATNPKSGIAKVQSPIERTRARGLSRPPSIQELKKLVNGPTPSALRYSVLPPPPMTDLEFWGALVQDYTRTAQCLPTLLSKKIRGGVPPPLRGVVWQSMSGARDRLLEDQFDRLCLESSPYEGIIGKDLGRSFPGVEMFRDPNGDGQLMLGRVLKCFSLYDHKIGYCQGLGFLVGPLLMHMGDKQAFCVLVRLMENYDLRNCFLPDLSGLHVRIYQFRELLKQHLPTLTAHLEILQVEPAYVSQWFLSFFAVTCPLPMLFRIYDLIFAEGASETIMRVALSLMRKNEQKILACTEFEDVMQLLLSRGLWDCYNYNADEFVNDFVGLTGVVTHDSLRALEMGYKASQAAEASPRSDVVSSASRFLGRLWSGSNSAAKTASLSPGSGLAVSSRPVSFLRRSASKQSIASTLSSIESGASESIGSHASTGTDATSLSRDSSNVDGTSTRAQSVSMNKDKNLHSQIEDLLTALSELQRDHAILATQLQIEREERDEDRIAVRSLLDGLRRRSRSDTRADRVKSTHSAGSLETVKPANVESDNETDIDSEYESMTEEIFSFEAAIAEEETEAVPPPRPTSDDLSLLLDTVEDRFAESEDNRSSIMVQTKPQLQDELTRAKERLITEVSRSQDLTRQISDQDQEISNLREELKREHLHIRNAHSERQRLEKQIQELLAKARKNSNTPTSPDKRKGSESEWPSRSSAPGLRELKLGRDTSRPTFNKRTSSLYPAGVNLNLALLENESPIPSSEPSPTKQFHPDSDSLVLELVQAKTGEATAKQEAEELKGKLEALRKLLSKTTGEALGHRLIPSQSSVSLDRGGTFAGYAAKEVKEPVHATAPTGGGFWGAWGKRTLSTGG